MRIEYTCSGGYGGLRFAYHCETEALPAAEARAILDLIDAARALELDEKQISANSRNIPDDFFCRLTLSSGQIHKTLSFNELSAPENLRRLSAYLRKLAIQGQGSR
ncbi:MAG: protealysin inhibitor emfourin [Desulfobacterales bacterium]|nr:protealysin inhibitor emfourin [Desulfobacterales bacterium]